MQQQRKLVESTKQVNWYIYTNMTTLQVNCGFLRLEKNERKSLMKKEKNTIRSGTTYLGKGFRLDLLFGAACFWARARVFRKGVCVWARNCVCVNILGLTRYAQKVFHLQGYQATQKRHKERRRRIVNR